MCVCTNKVSRAVLRRCPCVSMLKHVAEGEGLSGKFWTSARRFTTGQVYVYRSGSIWSCPLVSAKVPPADTYTWEIWHPDVSPRVDCRCACDHECMRAHLCVWEKPGVQARIGELGKVTTSQQRDQQVSQAGVDPSLSPFHLVCVQTQVLLDLWDCSQGPAGSPEVQDHWPSGGAAQVGSVSSGFLLAVRTGLWVTGGAQGAAGLAGWEMQLFP